MSKEMWKTLHKMHKGLDKVQRIHLYYQVSLKLYVYNFESIFDYYALVMIVGNQVRRTRKILKDMRFFETIVRFLIPKLDYIVVALEETKDMETLSIEELVGSL